MNIVLRLTAVCSLLFASHTLAQVTTDSLPANFPTPTTVYDSSRVADGEIFFSNFRFSGEQSGCYLIIAANDGTPIFYRAMPKPIIDFRLQPNGWLTYGSNAKHRYYAMDSNYVIVDSFATGNGVVTDIHDCRILPNGHALLLGQDSTLVDMSRIVAGGDSTAEVIGDRIQEVDDKGNVYFDWDGLQHFQVEDSRLVTLTGTSIDMEHANSLEVDTDGNILLSSRHIDEVTKIDRTTGEIMWRFGGAHNQFQLVGDTLWFSHQHDVRRIANGDITLWDNGNGHTPKFSRAAEYRLNTDSMTATLVWSFAPEEGYFSDAMGDVQRLPNGNTMIGLGDVPDRTAEEVAPDDTVVFYMVLPNSNVSYRVMRFPWKSKSSSLSVPMRQVLDEAALSVSPCPVTTQSMVYFGMERSGCATIELFDNLGRKVRTITTGTYGEGHHGVPLDVASLPAGTYHIVFSTANGVRTMNLPVIH